MEIEIIEGKSSLHKSEKYWNLSLEYWKEKVTFE